MAAQYYTDHLKLSLIGLHLLVPGIWDSPWSALVSIEPVQLEILAGKSVHTIPITVPKESKDTTDSRFDFNL